MGKVRYMISEAAKKLQVESHVLRYWEEELGLEIGRTDMGHRYYTEDDIQLFLCIQKLKNEGMLLRDLKYMIPELTAARKRLNSAKAEEGARRKEAGDKTNGTQAGKTAAISADGTGGRANEMQGADGRTSEILDGGADGRTAEIQNDRADGTSAEIQNGRADGTSAEIQNGRADGTSAEIQDSRADGKLDGVRNSRSGDMQDSMTECEADDMQESASLASARPSAPEADVIQVTQLEQVRSLIGDVLTDVVSANNEILKKDISRKVTSDVIREMDFLFQANERREEEHYRKLDVLIRQQQAGRREAARETPLGKLKKLLT
ncbi:MerR family transcriptional regulator [Lachnospiraceae bacterium]|jgi:DNA-binding transcriptional MerR regulator|nr:MerR family transcriptional regulator [uncultured Schaedlerella sp.]MCI9154883.1 MerR family transcriptional regulator [Ruminococcus sp.]NBI57688.1 MerR family transcriptional regulator [Lachnospiraceae bacterium]